MAIRQLNHAVLFVRDAERTATFYQDVLGFEVTHRMPGRGVFLRAAGSANDHDVAFFTIGSRAEPSTAGRSTVGLYHLAWEVETLGDLAALRERLAEAGALVGETDHSVSKSLYARDPDGLEFEIMWGVPVESLPEGVEPGIEPLDLAAELARYGPDTVGRLA
jgi:catechol-2,3-dioxygenase